MHSSDNSERETTIFALEELIFFYKNQQLKKIKLIGKGRNGEVYAYYLENVRVAEKLLHRKQGEREDKTLQHLSTAYISSILLDTV